MSTSFARNTIAVLWLTFGAIAVGMVLWMHLSDWIGDESLDILLLQLNRSYTPYLGIILAFYLGIYVLRGRNHKLNRSAFIAAVCSTVIWNATNLYFIWLLFLAKTQVASAAASLDRYSSMLAWILAPTMGFFFASHHNDATGPDQQKRHSYTRNAS